MTPARPVSNIRWWSLVTVASFAIALGITGYNDLRDEADDAARDRDALAAQVTRMGGTPVAGEPGKDGEQGPQGVPGRDGEDGSDGEDGTPGHQGSPGPSGSPGTDGTRGPAGAPGAKGDAGEPGAQGPVGPSGPAGPTGPAGEKGEKGDAGEPGDNVTCPEGSHPEEVAIVPYSGTYIVCKKDE